MTAKLQIAALDRAWVYIGAVEQTESGITISGAKCIRRWGTSKGLGQLALEGPQENTKLELYGEVEVPRHAVISLIDVQNLDAWRSHFPIAEPATEQPQTEQSQTEAA